jgi:mono/diheme cytochrome c family protein
MTDHPRVAPLLWAILLLGGCRRASAVEEADDGKQLFASVCARCHGESGSGGLFIDGGPAPQNFGDLAFQSSRTDEQIRQVILDGKGAAMPAFGGAFNDRELRALIVLVRRFGRRGPDSSPALQN